MADPGSVEPLFVSLRTTAALTSNSEDPFNQLLHHLNAILNVRAAGGSTSSGMYKSSVGELFECIARNERGMYGDSKNIAFLNFAKSFAALSDNNSMFDPLSLHCATASEASPSSVPPKLHPVSRDIYKILHDEQEYDQGGNGLAMNSSVNDGFINRPILLSPHYQTSSPTYEFEVKSEVDSEKELDVQRSTIPHETVINALFGSNNILAPPPPPIKKQKLSAPKVDPPEVHVCPYCTYQSTCPAHVTRHVRIDHPRHWLDFATFGCRSCDYRCRSTHTLKKHNRSIHGETWKQWVSQRRLNFPNDAKCPFCHEPTDDIHSLCQHVIDHHLNDINKDDPYIGCDACEEQFNWPSDLFAHWARPHSPCPGYVKLRKLKNAEVDNLEAAKGTVEGE